MKLITDPFNDNAIHYRDAAGIMVDRMFEGMMMTNAKGFRQPSDKVNRYRQPTLLERLMYRAEMSEESPYKTNSRLTSTRGNNRRRKEAQSRRRMKSMQAALEQARVDQANPTLKVSKVPAKVREMWLTNFWQQELA